MVIRVSRHITATPKEHKKGNHVDHAGIGGMEDAITWGGLIGCMTDEKSAEAIVGSRNELS